MRFILRKAKHVPNPSSVISFNKRGKHLNYTLFDCKHSLNFACLAHKGNATEVTKI